VINVQGDNLGITGFDLDRVIRKMAANPTIKYATLARPIAGGDWKVTLRNPNTVKVIVDPAGRALWFSRHAIPYLKNPDKRPDFKQFPYLEHLGVYFFRKRALEKYVSWPRSACEVAESLEQLRILENGEKIHVFLTSSDIVSVDSKAELKKFKPLSRRRRSSRDRR
jgi:3-deoxy-manno-octulosonate cytidylyltransferase (CMP-KDO synthetase)